MNVYLIVPEEAHGHCKFNTIDKIFRLSKLDTLLPIFARAMIRPLQIRPFLLKTLPLLSLGFTLLILDPAAGAPKTALAADAPAADDAAAAALAASDEPAGTVEALGPPADVWDRIRRGYAMPALESDKVDRWLDHYRRRPDYLNRMFERSCLLYTSEAADD